MRRLSFAGLLMAALFLAGPARGGEGRPVPPPAKLDEARKAVREIFKDDFAKTAAEDRFRLARTLIAQAGETQDDPAGRYVLLQEAADLAAANGSLPLAMTAIEELGKVFAVDGAALRLKVIDAAAAGAADPAAIAEFYLDAAGEAAGAGNLDLAARALSSARPLIEKSGKLALVGRLKRSESDLAEAHAAATAAETALVTLAEKPEEAEANRIAGRYVCLVLRDWKRGLPMLAKSGDPALAAAAAAEQNPVPAPLSLGDAWWEAAEKEEGFFQRAMRKRACGQYEKALVELSGLARLKVEKRLASFAAPAAPEATPPPASPDSAAQGGGAAPEATKPPDAPKAPEVAKAPEAVKPPDARKAPEEPKKDPAKKETVKKLTIPLGDDVWQVWMRSNRSYYSSNNWNSYPLPHLHGKFYTLSKADKTLAFKEIKTGIDGRGSYFRYYRDRDYLRLGYAKMIVGDFTATMRVQGSVDSVELWNDRAFYPTHSFGIEATGDRIVEVVLRKTGDTVTCLVDGAVSNSEDRLTDSAPPHVNARKGTILSIGFREGAAGFIVHGFRLEMAKK